MTNDDMDARPEAWEVTRCEATGEVTMIGPLWAGSADIGYAYVSDVRHFMDEQEPGVIDRVARLPVTEWERDRAVELLQSLVEEIDDKGSSGWYGIYKHTEKQVRDFIKEIEGGERG